MQETQTILFLAISSVALPQHTPHYRATHSHGKYHQNIINDTSF